MIDKDLILNWFTYECDSTPEEGTGDEIEWLLTGKMSGMDIAIIRPKGEAVIQIQRGIEIGADHKAVISGSSRERQAEFYYNLKRGLLLTGVRWQLKFSDSNESEFVEVRLYQTLFEDGLTREAFKQSLMMVHDATVLLLVELRHILETQSS